MQHLHMRQYVARPGQECKSELIIGAEKVASQPLVTITRFILIILFLSMG